MLPTKLAERARSGIVAHESLKTNRDFLGSDTDRSLLNRLMRQQGRRQGRLEVVVMIVWRWRASDVVQLQGQESRSIVFVEYYIYETVFSGSTGPFHRQLRRSSDTELRDVAARRCAYAAPNGDVEERESVICKSGLDVDRGDAMIGLRDQGSYSTPLGRDTRTKARVIT
jgi:hypothetical protein